MLGEERTGVCLGQSAKQHILSTKEKTKKKRERTALGEERTGTARVTGGGVGKVAGKELTTCPQYRKPRSKDACRISYNAYRAYNIR